MRSLEASCFSLVYTAQQPGSNDIAQNLPKFHAIVLIFWLHAKRVTWCCLLVWIHCALVLAVVAL